MEHLFFETVDQGIGPGGIGWERTHLTARQDEMVYSVIHHYHFVRVYFLFWGLMSVGPQLEQSRLTVLRIRYCPMALPPK